MLGRVRKRIRGVNRALQRLRNGDPPPHARASRAPGHLWRRVFPYNQHQAVYARGVHGFQAQIEHERRERGAFGPPPKGFLQVSPRAKAGQMRPIRALAILSRARERLADDRPALQRS